MSEATLGVPKRESSILRTLKSIALLRESVVGMIGAAIVLLWVLAALLAEVAIPKIDISFVIFSSPVEFTLIKERIFLSRSFLV